MSIRNKLIHVIVQTMWQNQGKPGMRIGYLPGYRGATGHPTTWLIGKPIFLDLGTDLPRPTPLEMDDRGISVKVSIGGRLTDLYIPWGAVSGALDHNSGYVVELPIEAEAEEPPKPPEPPAPSHHRGNVIHVDFSAKRPRLPTPA